MASPENIGRREFLKWTALMVSGVGVAVGTHDIQTLGRDLRELNKRYSSLSPLSRGLPEDRLEEARGVVAKAQGEESARLSEAYATIGRDAVRGDLLEEYASFYRRRTLDIVLMLLAMVWVKALSSIIKGTKLSEF